MVGLLFGVIRFADMPGCLRGEVPQAAEKNGQLTGVNYPINGATGFTSGRGLKPNPAVAGCSAVSG
jgi:hypothetical protein